jgi:hypothetical protein
LADDGKALCPIEDYDRLGEGFGLGGRPGHGHGQAVMAERGTVPRIDQMAQLNPSDLKGVTEASGDAEALIFQMRKADRRALVTSQ